MGDECKHSNLNNGVCVDCGLCSDFIEFKDEYTPRTTSFVQPSHFKYSIKNTEKELQKVIDKILIPLNLQNYNLQIKNLLKTTKFKYKLKPEDKVVVILYNTLKSDSFPICVDDLLRFTSMKKHKLLKVHRDTFKYETRSEEYLRSIFNRAVNVMGNKNERIINDSINEDLFSEFKIIQSAFKETDPQFLCFAILFECLDFTKKGNETVDKIDLNLKKIGYIRRKIRSKCFRIRELMVEQIISSRWFI